MDWTSERRARQAERIRQWKPWERSTGPRTPAGKAKAARNAWKGGLWRELCAFKCGVNAELRETRALLHRLRG